MSEDLRKQIYDSLNLKDTKELLEIWQTNDRVEWSDITFEVIGKILKKRRIKIPQQNKPVYEHVDQDNTAGFTEVELKIIDDKNPPDFYDPFDVIKTSRLLEMAAKIMIGLIIIANLVNIRISFNIAQGYLYQYPNSPIVYLAAFLLFALDAAIGVLATCLPLMALARVLKILMEMEFISRKAE